MIDLDGIWGVLMVIVSLVLVGITIAIMGVSAEGCRDTLIDWTGIRQPYTKACK